MAQKISQILVDKNFLTKEQLLTALKYQSSNGGKLTEALIATDIIQSIEEIGAFLAKQFESQELELKDIELDSSVVEIVPLDIAQKYGIIAIDKTNKVLTVAISDPKNLFVLDAVKFLTGCNVKPIMAPVEGIKEAIKLNYATDDDDVEEILSDIKEEEFEVLEGQDDDDAVDDISAAISEAPVVKLVNHIIVEAVKKDASDIHLETYQKVFRMRYRIDGRLMTISSLPYRLRPAIISRIKIMADLDISERRLPQDGRIKIKIGINTVDIRVSTIPTIYGEKVVMRILDASNLVLDMEKLGIPSTSLTHIMEAIHSPFGMFLVTGPTGSGKTTTLYSALSLLNQPYVNIMTVEDPVEYNIDGINQVNVNSDIGLSFASALRSFLRQDPDIIMLGEIRDGETAEIAIKSALTGHLVFSTLHTNNSVATIARLIDMGVEPFLVASSVRIVIAQRLVRKICPDCKEPVETNNEELARILHIDMDQAKKITQFKGTGCPLCNGTGFRGRCGLYEVMPATRGLQDLIIDRAPPNVLKDQALKDGMKTLKDCAMEKLIKGETTVEEMLSAIEI
ncbi:MAG: type II secretion system protein GspE [Chitinivibrionales bacterium]|nr:type II secretion system protein GspE [Chitinivibrionales bacterium]